jgi:hypothetical protein
MAYPTAIGCGCLLGAGGMSHLHAAQWSVQPVFSVTTDYDSDRNLSTSARGSEEAVLYGDLRLQRAIETTQILIEPKFDLRRYSDSIWGPGNDRSLNTAFTWTGERMKLNLTGSIADQTTLTTELYETGIITGNTRRRLKQVNGESDWLQSERRQTFLQLGYVGASYSGPPLVQLELPGYRYTSAALGERFFLSERLTLSVSAFGDALTSARQGNSSHEEGGQAELLEQYSENTSFDFAIGESKRSLYGQRGTGTNVVASVSHNMSLGTATLGYTRSLVPYGTGFLVERQQITATATRPLTPYLDGNITVMRIQNNSSTVRLGLDRPFYNNASLGLNWKMGESWTLQPQVTTSWSKPIQPFGSSQSVNTEKTVREWRAALTLVWQPLPDTRSR